MRTLQKQTCGFVTHHGLFSITGLGLLAALLLPAWGRPGWLARGAALLGVVALVALVVALGRFLLSFRSRRPPAPPKDISQP